MAKDKTTDNKSSAIEKRKKWNFIARFSLSLVVLFVFFVLLYVLFYGTLVTDTYRDIINILIGTYVAVLTKTADYWFKDKDDPEHKESEALTNGG
jgi:protein-S-isoprenylcysteine O-methyltransferase Ste14